jgi:DNA (cytosine-5)-methyltransferase 1
VPPLLQQMGNAVSPQVAAALGRCLALAALHDSPPGQMLIAVPDLDYDAVGWMAGWKI